MTTRWLGSAVVTQLHARLAPQVAFAGGGLDISGRSDDLSMHVDAIIVGKQP